MISKRINYIETISSPFVVHRQYFPFHTGIVSTATTWLGPALINAACVCFQWLKGTLNVPRLLEPIGAEPKTLNIPVRTLHMVAVLKPHMAKTFLQPTQE